MKMQQLNLALLGALTTSVASADSQDTMKKAFIDNSAVNVQFRLRFEQADVDNVGKQDQTTLRSRLTYKTGDLYDFFASAEVDDVRSTDEQALIADYEYTQINQAFLGYKAPASTLLKFGRQRIVLDNQRFVGGVGFRQNEQTYDAFSATSTAVKDLSAFYAYVDTVNRIFPEGSGKEEHENQTNLLNFNYKGISQVNFTAYAYLIDNQTVPSFSTDTYGVRAAGELSADKLKFSYEAEYASQSEGDNNPVDYSASYYMLGAGLSMAGFGAKLGHEVLGSGGNDGFITPLATLHAFNGWTDRFLFGGKGNWTNGIVDTHVILTAKLADLQLLAKYHKFDSDKGDIDMGNEWGVSASYGFGTHYNTSLKYASFSGADAGYAFSNDADILWLTLQVDY
jgi:hypothetical protein